MRRQSNEEPVLRWADSRGGDALDQELGETIRGLSAPRALSSRELAEVGMRLRSVGRRRPFLLGRYAVLLGVGMLAGTGFAVAGFGVKRWVAAPARVSNEPAPEAVPARRAAPVLRAVSRAVPESVPTAEEEILPEPARKPEAPAAPPVPSGGLGRESDILARALAKLRSEGDAAGALVVLDEYRREFPHGTLALESEVARLDAFLALGRHGEALRLLDTLPIDRIGRGAELRVVRAELRARETPAGAVRDFDLALAVALSGALEERALFGRAVSRMHAGNQAGAEADLRRYLERHPNGRFAAEARAKLGLEN
jgi:hypothetical protein